MWRVITNVGSATHSGLWNGKCFTTDEKQNPGKDGVTMEMLNSVIIKYLRKGKLTSLWMKSNIILVYKKDDREDLRNYRRMFRLFNIYKLSVT